MKKLDRLYILLGGVTMVVVIISCLVYLNSQKDVVLPRDDAPYSLTETEEPEDLKGGFATPLNVIGTGTTSATIYYINTTTPTTTGTLYIGRQVDMSDLNMYVIPSSTTSVVKWQYDFSDDKMEWFGEDAKSVSGSTVTHQAASTTHSWTPGTTEVSFRNIGITDMASKYFRLRVFRGINSKTAGNNFAIYVEGIFKE